MGTGARGAQGEGSEVGKSSSRRRALDPERLPRDAVATQAKGRRLAKTSESYGMENGSAKGAALQARARVHTTGSFWKHPPQQNNATVVFPGQPHEAIPRKGPHCHCHGPSQSLVGF